jgi:hypothetical protein
VTWAIYQNVALGQNMLKVERSLREVYRASRNGQFLARSFYF